LEDLEWLGVAWEGEVLKQSEHFALYRAAAAELEKRHLLYPCFATRGEIRRAAAHKPDAHDPDGAPLYPGLHKYMGLAEAARRRARGDPFVLRIDIERALEAVRERMGGQPLTFIEMAASGELRTIEARPERWGDAVIVRKDVPTSYHLAVVVDDARQGITHVTRGRDLFPATDLQRLLQVLLELPEPIYHHHRLITDETGRKLAKSAADTALAALRVRGLSPDDIRRLTGLVTGHGGS
jgi:glutamyl-Q tRNA(Asp) synthetase